MNLERRVRAELGRNAPTVVRPSPSLGEMESTVARRRRRNRIASGVAGAVFVVGAVGAYVALDGPGSSSDVIATGPAPATDADSAVAQGGAAAEAAAANNADTAVAIDPIDATPVGEPAQVVVEAPTADRTRTVELDANVSPVTIETRESAVVFAGSSGVFVVATDDGFRALASRFGGAQGVTMIGLESTDGLDWAEVELSGLPAGSTVTLLREIEGGVVALVSRFDPDEQQNTTSIATSPDLTDWVVGPAFPRDAVVADLASGPDGLVAVGMTPDPAVWVVPVDGPIELVGSIESASTLAGMVAVDSGFVAVGTAAGVPTLFDSVDGRAWTATPMSGLADGDSVIDVAGAGQSITIAGGGIAAWSASSADGGRTWQRSEIGTGTVGSVAIRGEEISVLGTSPLGVAQLTLADRSTWSSVDLDAAPGDRIDLLLSGTETILLAVGEDELTWVVASR